MKDKYSLIKWLIFAAFVAASIVFVTPIKDKVRLGLDLAGGTSFTVQIDQSKLRQDMRDANPSRKDSEIDAEIANIMKDADSRTIEVLRNRIDGMGVNEPVIVPGKDHRIIIEIPGADEKQRKEAEASVSQPAYLTFRLVHKNNAELVSNLFADNRVPDGYEMANVGDGRYYVRAANYDEISRQPGYKHNLASFCVPDPRCSFMLQPERLRDGREVYSPVFVLNREEMNGNELDSADIQFNSNSGEISVGLAFTRKGAAQFAKVTGYYCPNGSRNVNNQRGRQLAIVLDNTLYSAPEIRSRIDGGRAEISGNFNRDEAALLRNILNAGSLPAPIEVLEQRMIDASLGKDAISSGVIASAIGGGLVILFMLFYYCYFGIVADLALVLNIILLPLGMLLVSGVFSALGAVDTNAAGGLQLPVLTMPGIAGIVLTIGMAVDANVLIFERIREEFSLGKSPKAAISAGYDRAFLAIFDSNITTFLTAVILFVFGSGPIRGFAITLSAGIIVSMYTALMITRMVFNATVSEDRVKPYKMRQMFNIPKIDFLSKGKIAMITSASIIVITLAIFSIRCATNPRAVMSIDFTGGTVMSYTFEKTPSIEAIRNALTAGGIDDAIIQTQAGTSGEKSIVSVKSGYDVIGEIKIDKAIDSTIKKVFSDAGVVNCGQDTIGSQIGDDLKSDAFWAVIIALIGMIIYITIRFEFGFALGAIVALAHDVLITLGLYTLFGRQVGVTAIACLLTIVGYSVNDTIVIFDRIREDIKLDPRTPFKELCNRAINQTLSRTVLTSFTTLLATVSLFVFGGGAINDFALCMLVGIVVGIYSTIFIAAPVMVAWYKGHRPGFVEKA